MDTFKRTLAVIASHFGGLCLGVMVSCLVVDNAIEFEKYLMTVALWPITQALGLLTIEPVPLGLTLVVVMPLLLIASVVFWFLKRHWVFLLLVGVISFLSSLNTIKFMNHFLSA